MWLLTQLQTSYSVLLCWKHKFYSRIKFHVMYLLWNPCFWLLKVLNTSQTYFLKFQPSFSVPVSYKKYVPQSYANTSKGSKSTRIDHLSWDETQTGCYNPMTCWIKWSKIHWQKVYLIIFTFGLEQMPTDADQRKIPSMLESKYQFEKGIANKRSLTTDHKNIRIQPIYNQYD